MSRRKSHRRGGFTLVELMLVLLLLGVSSSIIGYGLCSVMPAGRQEAAFAKARILNTARCSYALSVPDAESLWLGAGTDQARFALLASSGVVEGVASDYLSSSGGYTLSLSGVLRDSTHVYRDNQEQGYQ